MDKQEIIELIQLKTENKNLDYKEKFNWNRATKKEKVEIIKDILAMVNTQDGGRIIFGVRNKDYDFVGLSKKDFESFDQTDVNNLLHEYSEPRLNCQVYKYKKILNDKNTLVIDIGEFLEIPIICKKDFQTKDNKHILKRGHIYIRTNKATSESINTPEQMRDLLGRAIIKKSDELLDNIRRLIKGKPMKITEEYQKKFQEEIEESDQFFEENIGNELRKFGNWELCVYPVSYYKDLINNQSEIKDLTEKSEVLLMGWNFPHSDIQGNASNFSKGRKSFTIRHKHIEAYIAYLSGLFVYKKIFWEDIIDIGHSKPVLEFRHAVWTVTEFLIFIKRYFELIPYFGDLYLKISLGKTKDRILTSLDENYNYTGGLVSRESTILIEDNFKMVDIKANYKEIAREIIKRIFLIFNWDKPSEEIIDQLQSKLIERKE